MMKPESSSTAYSAFSMSESRETSRKSACEATARTNSGVKPWRSSSAMPVRGWPSSASMSGWRS